MFHAVTQCRNFNTAYLFACPLFAKTLNVKGTYLTSGLIVRLDDEVCEEYYDIAT